ncbi:unnamed protein product [Paramecium octaurelia]|uniref:Uncharacterized protein n=1 Tax=Paramecium octaurelia TaxID=43137 RepID=A0A8S1U7W9_PAROT|nr:unnamed protein product [Paramecium octaurelia]
MDKQELCGHLGKLSSAQRCTSERIILSCMKKIVNMSLEHQSEQVKNQFNKRKLMRSLNQSHKKQQTLINQHSVQYQKEGLKDDIQNNHQRRIFILQHQEQQQYISRSDTCFYVLETFSMQNIHILLAIQLPQVWYIVGIKNKQHYIQVAENCNVSIFTALCYYYTCPHRQNHYMGLLIYKSLNVKSCCSIQTKFKESRRDLLYSVKVHNIHDLYLPIKPPQLIVQMVLFSSVLVNRISSIEDKVKFLLSCLARATHLHRMPALGQDVYTSNGRSQSCKHTQKNNSKFKQFSFLSEFYFNQQSLKHLRFLQYLATYKQKIWYEKKSQIFSFIKQFQLFIQKTQIMCIQCNIIVKEKIVSLIQLLGCIYYSFNYLIYKKYVFIYFIQKLP